MKRLSLLLLILACFILNSCKEYHLDIDPHEITRVVIKDQYGFISTKNRKDIKKLISAMNKALPNPVPGDNPKMTVIELYLNNKLAYSIQASALLN